MVDCRPAAAAPHDQHPAPNGATPPEPHHTQLNQQGGGSGDMGGLGATPPGARASTPAAPHHVPYAPHYQSPAMNPPVNMPLGMPMAGVAPYMGYMCGGKGLVWVPPPPPPPPPHHVNPHAMKSMQANGADLPMNDIPTLRYYFNLGVDCMWAAYGPPPPPRHYSPRDIAQDMQQMSLQDRGSNHSQEMGHKHGPDAGHKHGQDMGHKHKGSPADKPLQNNGKGGGQRSLLGPRFNKRGNGQDNANPNHNQNKNHNNNNHMNNKGPNNRTYYRGGAGYEGEALGEGVLTLPYIPYPPPVYPLQYYPVDANDPAMMGMMGGMQYCGVAGVAGAGYEEPIDYPHYYPPPPFHLPHLPHNEHK